MLQRVIVSASALMLCALASLQAQRYSVSQTGVFAPQNQKILLLREPTGQKPVILFQTQLRVNTDGSPLSYHPQDLLGRDKALNNICNAVAVRRVGANANLCLSKPTFPEAIRVFEQFRDANYQTVPSGFTITWTNVLAAVKAQGREVPCVFASGPFQGYFGSLTALKNGLTGDKGECDLNDQVNPTDVPGLVLAGGMNPVRDFGAGVGDLVVALHPRTLRVSAAIINDTGPDNNLGEGSIRLNMSLLGATDLPKNRGETFRLSITDTQVVVAILPGSRTFKRERPFTTANIDARVGAWLQEAGFARREQFVDLMKSFALELQ